MTQSTTSTASGNPDRPYDPEDLSSKAFWSTTSDEREKTFARLRERDTITWHPPMEDSLLDDPEDFGFWAITTYDDLVAVTKRPDDFLSGPGILMESLPDEIVESAQSIIAMDRPRHTKMRKLVASAFTPKQMRRIDDRIRANARRVVDNLVEKAAAGGGTCDFVAECSELLPMHNINDIMGVPEGDRQQANTDMKVLVGWNDPELVGDTPDEVMAAQFQAIVSAHQLCIRLADERRSEPRDDLITALVEAEVDGEKLTDEDIAAFFCLLTVAGTDTTRQSASHGLRALTDFPDQRDWLVADLEGRMTGAVEEFVRWATPIMTFRRTAAHDVEFRGRTITEGDKVVMFYSSANRDGSRIDRPHEFDLSRTENPHVSFGGGGIHHCLGNQLARLQLGVLFTELLGRAPTITAGEPELVPGNFFHVVKRMAAHVPGD